MKIIESITEMKKWSVEHRRKGKRIGFVPTMGYLHEGHLSLIREAKKHADLVVMSIFVNPAQFGPGEDFETYPRDFERDQELARGAGIEGLFYPTQKMMYPDGYRTYIEVEEWGSVLEGVTRPGHFRGVATVVAKLFQAVHPDIAVFGQKDAQQVQIIRQMTRDLNFDTEILVAPIFREPDGLAMSSRNVYLDPDQRQDAVCLHQALRLAGEKIRTGTRDSFLIISEMRKLIDSRPTARIDYIKSVDERSLKELEILQGKVLFLVAVYFGKTRLIDNLVVDC